MRSSIMTGGDSVRLLLLPLSITVCSALHSATEDSGCLEHSPTFNADASDFPTPAQLISASKTPLPEFISASNFSPLPELIFACTEVSMHPSLSGFRVLEPGELQQVPARPSSTGCTASALLFLDSFSEYPRCIFVASEEIVACSNSPWLFAKLSGASEPCTWQWPCCDLRCTFSRWGRCICMCDSSHFASDNRASSSTKQPAKDSKPDAISATWPVTESRPSFTSAHDVASGLRACASSTLAIRLLQELSIFSHFSCKRLNRRCRPHRVDSTRAKAWVCCSPNRFTPSSSETYHQGIDTGPETTLPAFRAEIVLMDAAFSGQSGRSTIQRPHQTACLKPSG
mmetsp:Transcript_127112/g.254016  ORF Transcript_127112/g.254016 Transcript_127112/m.254016 type:complete len:342 (-) Transcript_127112:18-1043(-)